VCHVTNALVVVAVAARDDLAGEEETTVPDHASRPSTRVSSDRTLHLLLGDLYTRTGLTDLAAESFDEAQFRLKK
jgi:hypothetical protein